MLLTSLRRAGVISYNFISVVFQLECTEETYCCTFNGLSLIFEYFPTCILHRSSVSVFFTKYTVLHKKKKDKGFFSPSDI